MTVTAITLYVTHSFLFTKAKVLTAFLVGLFGVMIGGYDAMKHALFILLIIDFTLGFTNAWLDKTLNANKMHLGMIKIVGYCTTLVVLNYTDIAIGHMSINGFGLVEFGVAYLALNESLSTLRHLSKLGVPIPKGMIKRLQNYKEELDNK